jgi:hypothetical protein
MGPRLQILSAMLSGGARKSRPGVDRSAERFHPQRKGEWVGMLTLRGPFTLSDFHLLESS